MTFQEILAVAISRAGSRNKLARDLGVNHNAPRNWVIGLALPTPEKEEALAKAAGLSQEMVEQAINRERRERWMRLRQRLDAQLLLLTPPGALALLARPLAKARRRVA